MMYTSFCIKIQRKWYYTLPPRVPYRGYELSELTASITASAISSR